MVHESPHDKSQVPGSDLPPASPPQEDAAEAAVPAESAGEPVEEPTPDPYDELWDPDMDIRPVRIRKTRVKSRTDIRPRGGGSPFGRRREGS